MNQKLLWCDLETTGLSLQDQCLEVGLVVTAPNLDVLDVACYQLYFTGLLDPLVLEMHTKNGLLKQCANTSLFTSDADVELADFVKKNWPEGSDRPMLAGRNVGTFDKPRLERWFPLVHALCHYRVFDMTTVGTYEEVKYPKGPVLHRSLPDIYSDLLELRHRLTKGGSVIA